MKKDEVSEQEKAIANGHLTVEDSRPASVDSVPLKISNPDGVRRAIGIFRDAPLLDDLMDNIRQLREEQRNSEKAA